eukprot:Pgem_evm1s3633
MSKKRRSSKNDCVPDSCVANNTFITDLLGQYQKESEEKDKLFDIRQEKLKAELRNHHKEVRDNPGSSAKLSFMKAEFKKERKELKILLCSWNTGNADIPTDLA